MAIKLFITDFDREKFRPKELSALVKPFYDVSTGSWSCCREIMEKRGCGDLEVEIVSSIDLADKVLVSEPLEHEHNQERYKQLSELNSQCRTRSIFAHVFVNGDFGTVHPKFSNVIYYRLGGFKSQLNENNKGFYPLLSDQLKKLFERDKIFTRRKEALPTVGFCGHASYSLPKYFYEKVKFVRTNVQRIISGDFALEPLFSSAFERQKLLDILARSDLVKTNFVSRSRYRAGATSELDRARTTLEYYKNLIDSDYVLCLRGGGNFSVRLYETLMMGRIPIFMNTDCLLPLEDKINWKKHVVWVEWRDRFQVAEKVAEHYSRLAPEEYLELQEMNRYLWTNRLRIREYF